MLRKELHLVVVALFITANVHAQKIDTMGELRNAYASLKGTKSMGYDYNSDVVFPNGNRDYIKGKMFVNYAERYIYNDCSAYTMLFTKHFFYKADHRQKTIMFVNTDKNYDRQLKKKTEQDIFEGGAIEKYADTSMLRTAIIKEIKISNEGVLSVVLSFPAGSLLRRLDLIYDKIKKMPVSYSVEIFQPSPEGNGHIKGVAVKMKCNNFTSSIDKSELVSNQYFTYARGKLELKKYDTYKTITNSTQK